MARREWLPSLAEIREPERVARPGPGTLGGDTTRPDRAAMATVLAVDDEPDILVIVKVNLELDGHDVLLAHSGAEALEMVAPAAPGPGDPRHDDAGRRRLGRARPAQERPRPKAATCP